jgi:hypothetical protein
MQFILRQSALYGSLSFQTLEVVQVRTQFSCDIALHHYMINAHCFWNVLKKPQVEIYFSKVQEQEIEIPV